MGFSGRRPNPFNRLVATLRQNRNGSRCGQGQGASGSWIFELSRPLNTGDAQDAQLQPGSMANMALAYWDADETPDDWTDLGHLQSSSFGWIEVALP